MNMREPLRWEDAVPRRQACVVAIVVAVVVCALPTLACGVVLERRVDAAAARLSAACQDNRQRAYGSALRVGEVEVSQAEAIKAAKAYVREVRLTPECFNTNVQADAEAVARAINGRGRPAPKYPKYVL